MSTQVIPKLADYFGSPHPIPIVEAGWHEESGTWVTSPLGRRISRSWLYEIRDWGFTRVRITRDGRRAEFSVEELLA
jgi:hypothetical protein